jgi:hypothetical protein
MIEFKYCPTCTTKLEGDRLPVPTVRPSTDGYIKYTVVKWRYYLFCPKCRRIKKKVKKEDVKNLF